MRIKPTSAKAAKFAWFGEFCLGLNDYGSRAVKSGPITIICKYTPEEAILIAVTPACFQLWPHDGDLKDLEITTSSLSKNNFKLKVTEFGGWYEGEKAWATIFSQSPFHMHYDEVRGTFIASVDKDTEKAEVEFHGGYMANCYWTDGKGNYLNWRGTPNRHFYLDNEYYIPGTTRLDEAVNTTNLGSIFYTPFDEYIYEGGDRLAKAPQAMPVDEFSTPVNNLVTGAMYIDGTLYCIAHINRRGAEGGHWEEVYKQVGDVAKGVVHPEKGWKLVGKRQLTERPKVQAFISEDGTRFMAFDGVLGTIDHKKESVTYASPVISSSGKQTLTFGGGYWSDTKFNGTATAKMWPELDEIVEVVTEAKSAALSTSTGSSSTRNVPKRLSGKIADGISVSFEPDALAIKAYYLDLYGSSPPSGCIPWAAVATPNGRYCKIELALMAVNGCAAPSFKTRGNLIAGCLSTGCKDTNFYVTATADGITGKSGDYSTTNCSGTLSPQIVSAGTNQYTYTGKITSPTNPAVSWSVSGADIVSGANSSIVTIGNSCGAYSLSVSGACGLASLSVNPNFILTISGPSPTYVGAQYVVNTSCEGTWSADNGVSIDQSGTITAVNCSVNGSGLAISTITFTLASYPPSTLSVRHPNGHWTYTTPDDSVNANCQSGDPCNYPIGGPYTGTCDTGGGYGINYTVCYVGVIDRRDGSTNYCLAGGGAFAIPACFDSDHPGVPHENTTWHPYYTYVLRMVWYRTQKWVC